MQSLHARAILYFAAVVFLSGPCAYVHADQVSDTCLADALANADDSTTVGELRLLCQQEADAMDTGDMSAYEKSAVMERFGGERAIEDRPFVITPHNPNYLIYSFMDEANQAPFQDISPIVDPVEDNEAVFQVSIKAPVWRSVFGSNADLYFAYTAKSWWQVMNDDISSPFRETNYEPEFFLRGFSNQEFLGMKLRIWELGFNHQSNGQTEPLSRSWNRIMGRAGVQITDDLTFLARAWYRIPEDEEDDDNPYEYRYLGYGDIRAIWTPGKNTFTAMIRPGTEETAYELTWSRPISSVFRIYAQYYKGHGESLLDYDFEIERFGIGIAMNDFLGRY